MTEQTTGMADTWRATSEPLVLHVIPTPLARGAQREARSLADRLDAPGVRAHRVLSLFTGPPEVRPDLALRFPGGERAAQGFEPVLVSKLRSALRRFDPALVVAHGGDPLKYLVPAMIGRRRPLVYYAIGTYAGPRDRRVRLALWRRLVARVDAVAAEGEEVEAECVRLLGVPAHRVTMTPNGRDPEQFHPGPPEPDRPLTLTFVGALTEGKRPNRFVEVVAALRARGLRFDAQVVGDGPMRASLTEAAASAGVALLGSRPDVADLLRRSDVMVFPSRSVGEGMPGVLIEAGLSGVPVAATDVPGVRTIVVDGETGMVVPEDDLGSLVSAVARLVEDPTRRLSMGRAARQRCVDRFSLESVADAWLRVLLPLLPPVSSGPGAAAPE